MKARGRIDPVATTTLTLTKYHGLGNDFLVVDDRDRTGRFDATLVAALCERHRGIGADGVLRLSAPAGPGAFAMELRNADGGVAETSGNGLRCAVLAAAHAGLLGSAGLEGGDIAVETLAGVVRARLAGTRPSVLGAEAEIRVEMGVAVVEDLEHSPLPGRRASTVDVGNPHLVLLGERMDDVDLGVLGPALEASRALGTNVEVAAERDGELDLVVWERGAGLTLACGSGSCAVAAAARARGIVGDWVVVNNPGGPLVVEATGPDRHRPLVSLTGPARRVGKVVIDTEDLDLAPWSDA